MINRHRQRLMRSFWQQKTYQIKIWPISHSRSSSQACPNSYFYCLEAPFWPPALCALHTFSRRSHSFRPQRRRVSWLGACSSFFLPSFFVQYEQDCSYWIRPSSWDATVSSSIMHWGLWEWTFYLMCICACDSFHSSPGLCARFGPLSQSELFPTK